MVRVSVLNTKTWVVLLRKVLDELGFEVSNDYSRSDVVFWFYGSALWQLKLWKLWFLRGKKVFVFWIGSDVLNFTRPKGLIMKFYVFLNKLLLRLISKKHDVKHLTSAPWLVSELRSVGVNAVFIPLQTIREGNDYGRDWDEREFDYVSYLPLKNWFFYGGDKIRDLALSEPKKKFLIVIPDYNRDSPELNNQELLKKLPDNVVFTGWMLREEYLRILGNSKYFLRLTKHDSLSCSVIEALFNGCIVIWDYKDKIKGLKNLYSTRELIFFNKNEWGDNWEWNKKIILEKYSFKALKEKVRGLLG